MDKYRRVCHLAASAPAGCISTGLGELQEPGCTSYRQSHAKRRPAAAMQSVPVPWSCTVGSRALLIQQEGMREMAELQQITLSKTESPKYIRIDIIKWGSVDLKVQCHPHQALDEGSFALQKPFYEVNYINYQHLKTSNI